MSTHKSTHLGTNQSAATLPNGPSSNVTRCKALWREVSWCKWKGQTDSSRAPVDGTMCNAVAHVNLDSSSDITVATQWAEIVIRGL